MILGRYIAGRLYRHSNAVIATGLIVAAISSFVLQFDLLPVLSSALFCAAGLGMSAAWPILMAVCTKEYAPVIHTDFAI